MRLAHSGRIVYGQTGNDTDHHVEPEDENSQSNEDRNCHTIWFVLRAENKILLISTPASNRDEWLSNEQLLTPSHI